MFDTVGLVAIIGRVTMGLFVSTISCTKTGCSSKAIVPIYTRVVVFPIYS
jgi:hypothetical protein